MRRQRNKARLSDNANTPFPSRLKWAKRLCIRLKGDKDSLHEARESMSNIKHLLALDIGTTSVKGALFDAAGAILAEGLQEYDLFKPAPDWVELDCDVYWQAAVNVIGHILKTSGVPPEAIVSLGA